MSVMFRHSILTTLTAATLGVALATAAHAAGPHAVPAAAATPVSWFSALDQSFQEGLRWLTGQVSPHALRPADTPGPNGQCNVTQDPQGTCKPIQVNVLKQVSTK
jgi:hypothetical protein